MRYNHFVSFLNLKQLTLSPASNKLRKLFHGLEGNNRRDLIVTYYQSSVSIKQAIFRSSLFPFLCFEPQRLMQVIIKIFLKIHKFVISKRNDLKYNTLSSNLSFISLKNVLYSETYHCDNFG